MEKKKTKNFIIKYNKKKKFRIGNKNPFITKILFYFPLPIPIIFKDLLMWTIESWAKLEEDFERAKKNENKWKPFDDSFVYKTISLMWENKHLEEDRTTASREKNKKNATKKKEHKLQLEKKSEKNKKKRKNEQISKPKKRYKNDPNGKVNSRMLYNYQYQILEERFQLKNYPSNDDIEEIAKELEITIEKVKNWFYNRRKKRKKEKN